MESFLDTLIDRKDLMAWRADRARSLVRSLAIVQSTFGVEAIDMRYSWSAQNNAVLLASLLRLVAPPQVGDSTPRFLLLLLLLLLLLHLLLFLFLHLQ